MKTKSFFIFSLMLNSLIAFSQNQFINSKQFNAIVKLNNLQKINGMGAKSVAIYKFTETGDSILSATHSFAYNQNNQIIQISSMLYDSCSIMNDKYLLPSGNYITNYSYDTNGVILEIICKNINGDTIEKINYNHFQDSSIYEYQAMQDNLLTNQIRFIFYGIKDFNHTQILDEVHRRFFDNIDLILYHSDSIKCYDWKDSSWTLYQLNYFNYNKEGQPLRLLSLFLYSSSITGYFSDSLYYDSDSSCDKIIISLSVPYWGSEGKLYSFSIEKNNQKKIIKKTTITYNDILTFDFYGLEEIFIYDNNGVLLKECYFKGLTETNWKPYYTYVYNKTKIDEPSTEERILLFPNPTPTILNICNEKLIYKISFYNTIGQKVKQTIVNSNETTLDVSTLPAGMYLVKINTEQGVLTRKVQIIR
ncbi:MAG: T9SS type A sorting domain-containing protein [Bacteroidales bacterium]|nr:T9SS type A sorting domain-containing protein [Bacteroidales bacterium]